MLYNALQISNPSEINLFRAMMAYFAQNNTNTLIQEHHKHIVSFNCYDPNNRLTVFNNVRKEISDLLIITYSVQTKTARATFLQAKYSKHLLLQPFRFRGDVFQWFLLSQRPQIQDNNAKPLPPDILRLALLNSIGSFGVFYQNKGCIDFAFSTANSIDYYSKTSFSISNKQKILSFRYPNVQFSYPNGLIDLQTSYGANRFENALYSMHIGSPICNTTIQNLLSTYYSSHDGIKRMFDSLGIPPLVNIGYGSLNNILVIHVEKSS